MEIWDSTAAYEAWLRTQLSGAVIEDDLQKKREKMRADPFSFLRATYWRFAESVVKLCPEFAKAPQVLAIGDIHVENFGTWSDAADRLVWGVNDFDEAADMPYAFDLIRLGASAVLAATGMSSEAISEELLSGYRAGLLDPAPTMVDGPIGWLRKRFVATDKDRREFWKKFDPGEHQHAQPPPAFATALAASVPEVATLLAYWPRSAGAGSLGRPRWIGAWLSGGDTIIREAKAMVPSAWLRGRATKGAPVRVIEIAKGRFRSADPHYRLDGSILVRRLSPNSRKLDLEFVKYRSKLVDKDTVVAMGFEVASIHRGTRGKRAELQADLDRRTAKELRKAIERVAHHIDRERALFAYCGPTTPRAGRARQKEPAG